MVESSRTKTLAEAARARDSARDRRSEALAIYDRTADLVATSRALIDLVVLRQRARVVSYTEWLDSGDAPRSEAFVAFQAARIGRDPIIEQAKSVLSERFHVSRGDAWAIVRHISNRQNRNVADIARSVVDSAAAHRQHHSSDA